MQTTDDKVRLKGYKSQYVGMASHTSVSSNLLQPGIDPLCSCNAQGSLKWAESQLCVCLTEYRDAIKNEWRWDRKGQQGEYWTQPLRYMYSGNSAGSTRIMRGDADSSGFGQETSRGQTFFILAIQDVGKTANVHWCHMWGLGISCTSVGFMQDHKFISQRCCSITSGKKTRTCEWWWQLTHTHHTGAHSCLHFS